MKISTLKLSSPFILAPMMEVTNLPYRLLCRKQGASLAFTEMLYTNQIIHKNKKINQILKTSKEDKPLGIQITGNSLPEFKACIPILKKYDLVDLNCGCPSTRVTGTKAGSYLLQNPKLIAQIIELLKSHNLIVTAKIRLGFNKNNALEIAKTIEKAGADGITIHARTSSQPYSIPADWKEIKKVKDALKIPVIANGDIFTYEDAQKLLKFADGIMIGRGAIGNPLIFKQLQNPSYEPTQREKTEQFKLYIKLCKKHKMINLQQIKHLGSHFLKGFPGSSKKRNELMKMKTLKDVEDFIQKSIIITHKLPQH